MPDATLGVARNLDSLDLAKVGLQGVMVNTYHLMQKPGEKILQELGGIKKRCIGLVLFLQILVAFNCFL
jgi:tRNA-guanine family transglycosylase